MNYFPLFKYILGFFTLMLISCEIGIQLQINLYGNYYVAEIPSHEGKSIIFQISKSSGYNILATYVQLIKGNKDSILVQNLEINNQKKYFFIYIDTITKFPLQPNEIEKSEFDFLYKKIKSTYQYHFDF